MCRFLFQIDVTWFPYDQQTCSVMLMTWSHPGSLVDLRQLPEDKVKFQKCTEEGFPVYLIELGMDLSYFYKYNNHKPTRARLMSFSIAEVPNGIY